MPKKEWTYEAVSQRLKEGKVKASIVQRGGMLWLQTTLPPKPGSERPRPYQQKISLGVPANEDGFRRAEQEARLLGSLLASGKFDWNAYIRAERLPENKPARVWIEEFKLHYMQTHALKESTWKNQWDKVFKRLSPDQPLYAETLVSLVHQTDRNTRNRAETCRKFQQLADFAGLKVDLLQYKGSYGAAKVQGRDIPSDETIAYWWTQIPNPSWQWVYGVMAALGLRDHEVFFCEWLDDGLFVTKGKTGPRLVFQALYEEWVDEWNLRTINRPKVSDADALYEAGKLGDKVARQFRRYGIPFTPYDLRHAFGIRSSVKFELPVTTAAALMGHSPEIHLKRYHRHIQLRQNQDAAKRIMERPDRPKPPQIRLNDV